jgi:hypothetical protein
LVTPLGWQYGGTILEPASPESPLTATAMMRFASTPTRKKSSREKTGADRAPKFYCDFTQAGKVFFCAAKITLAPDFSGRYACAAKGEGE